MYSYMYISYKKDKTYNQKPVHATNYIVYKRTDSIRYLYNILNRDIFLQVVFAIGLQSIVCESIERGSREEVQGILWGHGHIPIINKLQ